MKKNKRILAFGLLGLLGVGTLASVLVACKPENKTTIQDFELLCQKYSQQYANDQYSAQIMKIIDEHKAIAQQISAGDQKNQSKKFQELMQSLDQAIKQFISHQKILKEEKENTVNFTPVKEKIKMYYKNAQNISFADYTDFQIKDIIVELNDQTFTYEIKSIKKITDGLQITYNLTKNKQTSEDFIYLIPSSNFQNSSGEPIDFSALNQQITINYQNIENTTFDEAIADAAYLDIKKPADLKVNIQSVTKSADDYIIVYVIQKNNQSSTNLTLKINRESFQNPNDDLAKKLETIDWDSFNQHTTVKFVNQHETYFEDVPQEITSQNVRFSHTNYGVKNFEFISAMKEGREIIVKYTMTYNGQTSKILEKSILARHFKQHKTKEYTELEKQYTATDAKLKNNQHDPLSKDLAVNLESVYSITEKEIILIEKQTTAVNRLKKHLLIVDQLLQINEKLNVLKTTGQKTEAEMQKAQTLSQEIENLFKQNVANIDLELLSSGFEKIISKLYSEFIGAKPMTSFETLGSLTTNDEMLKLGERNSEVDQNSVLTYKIIDNDHIDITISNVVFDQKKYTDNKYNEKITEVFAAFNLLQLNPKNRFDYEPDTADYSYIHSDKKIQNPITGLRYKPASLSFFDQQTYLAKITKKADLKTLINDLQTKKALIFKNVNIPGIGKILNENSRICFAMSDFNMLKENKNMPGTTETLFETKYGDNGVSFLGNETIGPKTKKYHHERPSVIVFKTKMQENQ
ncbi:hypothetical protein [Ureaplasma zalophigenitalium]|uniref:Lipoprotein n=1 Tax=Ureaplasma zalophigenitalium TaxID=907723 RepID=A0ABT3BP35_9BACT|nr:hypothetical protein [Ureaplasma zalophigenitalium]MCV3753999.1 hypothetical protein [Ureaplasma zalophigenitalium]